MIPIIPNILNINNLGSSSENFIILDITRKLIKYYFKNASDKAMFTLIVFEISLFEGKSVLWPAQWAAGSARVKIITSTSSSE